MQVPIYCYPKLRQAYCGKWRSESRVLSALRTYAFLLGGAEDFSRLYAQSSSRICPDSYPEVLPPRVKHVNYEAAHCYAEILNVLNFTSTRHCVVVTCRTHVSLYSRMRHKFRLPGPADSLDWIHGKSDLLIGCWAASRWRKYFSCLEVICAIRWTIFFSCL
jgi:hypothetical protein